MDSDNPIPFLVGWGSEKPDGSGVDVAELCALKQLACLNERVSRYYKPGIQVNIRVEDASAPHLFVDDQDVARRNAKLYTDGFVGLVSVLELPFIKAVPESTLTNEKAFNAEADQWVDLMRDHITDPFNESAAQVLAIGGWNPLHPETIEFYARRYEKLYPHYTLGQRIYAMARYFAGAFARVRLGITGADTSWNKRFIELSFTGPTPGFDPARTLRRIYYRTMPCSITSNHIPAWRAKGFLKINGECSAGLTTFGTKDYAFNPHTITLTNGETSQVVQADYVVEEDSVQDS
jgi:hypothetical protein